MWITWLESIYLPYFSIEPIWFVNFAQLLFSVISVKFLKKFTESLNLYSR